ncbi:Uncharacterized protein FWK35_00009086 [Aphis craccivora]|uniref:Uncharacterized protein n=1 Tax=Aphis craccivora TaxID=307492 RepID=A0A6G0ZGT3_APHCR|nr:Uncharacterized protein FWK35_00009086 [Aphis craccivora]
MSPVSDRKVNLVGISGGQNVSKNPKKVTEKREFLRKTSFRQNRFFYMVLNFQQFLTFFDSHFYEICRKRENLQYKSVDKFWLTFELRVENLIGTRLTNHLGSESFFVYNDNYHWIQI